MRSDVIEKNPGIFGGLPVFAGTRVPIYYLFAVLAEGHDYRYFLEDYSTVKEEQVLAVLEEAKKALLDAPDLLEEIQRTREDFRDSLIDVAKEIAKGFEELKEQKQ